MTITIGIDIGSGAVKSVLFRHGPNGPEWLAKRCERIRRRDPMQLADEGRDVSPSRSAALELADERRLPIRPLAARTSFHRSAPTDAFRVRFAVRNDRLRRESMSSIQLSRTRNVRRK